MPHHERDFDGQGARTAEEVSLNQANVRRRGVPFLFQWPRSIPATRSKYKMPEKGVLCLGETRVMGIEQGKDFLN